MFTKSFIAAAMLLSLAGAASAVTPITLVPAGTNQYSGQFQAASNSATFSLDLTGFTGATLVTSLVTANSIFGQGYNITSATFDGLAFTPVVNATYGPATVDYWTYGSVAVSAAVHTIVITGTSLGGGTFSGSVGISETPITPPPVPEPGTYALMLAGLGAVGFVAARRRQRV